MKKYILAIAYIALTFPVFSAEIRILPHGTKKIVLHTFEKLHFHLDEQYAKKLSEQKYEPYDPSMLKYAGAPILLIITKDDKGKAIYAIYSYHQDEKNSYFLKKKFIITDDIIHDIDVDPTDGIFKAKKMPLLIMCAQKP